jgi:hypothetical protein
MKARMEFLTPWRMRPKGSTTTGDGNIEITNANITIVEKKEMNK